MQVKTLHRILGEMIATGCGHKPVCVDKETFVHALEGDGVVILGVVSVELQTHKMSDDDGGWKENKDGSIAQRTSCVLSGSGERCEVCRTVDCTEPNHSR